MSSHKESVILIDVEPQPNDALRAWWNRLMTQTAAMHESHAFVEMPAQPEFSKRYATLADFSAPDPDSTDHDP